MGFGERLKKYRQDVGMKQTTLGEAIGKTGQVISNWERGYTTSITSEDLQSLAKALNITADQLVGEQSADNIALRYLARVKPYTFSDALNDIGKEYYTDPETAQLAQEAHDNPDLKILFDASRKLSPQDLKTVTALVKSLAGDKDE